MTMFPRWGSGEITPQEKFFYSVAKELGYRGMDVLASDSWVRVRLDEQEITLTLRYGEGKHCRHWEPDPHDPNDHEYILNALRRAISMQQSIDIPPL